VIVEYGALDLSEPAAVAEYERAFYEGFVGVVGNRLIRDLWIWDDEARRLRTRVPYEDQVVFVARNGEGRIETAFATNLALRHFQSEAYGFSIEGDAAGCGEVLTFFTLGAKRLGERLLFVDACFAELRARGLHTAYTTIGPHLLLTYRRLGAEVLAAREIRGETRYFLRFSVQRLAERRRSASDAVAVDLPIHVDVGRR
jgi:hypothetical protein